MSHIGKHLIAALGCFLGSFALSGSPALAAGEADHTCSNATLKGAYGFVTGTIVVPANTPRGVIGRWIFDGQGHFTNPSLTINDNGTILRFTDAGTYSVAPDCTGTILPVVGGGSLDIIVVDGGKEFYQLRTSPEGLVLIYSTAKKQFPDKDEDR